MQMVCGQLVDIQAEQFVGDSQNDSGAALPSPILPSLDEESSDITLSVLANRTHEPDDKSSVKVNRRISLYMENPHVSPSDDSPQQRLNLNSQEQENIPPSPVQPSPSWLISRYSPPKLVGLESLLEGRVLRSRRTPLLPSKPNNNMLRFHVFTGQTLDEACQPKFPGAAPLDPKLVLTLTRRRTRLRQQKARRLGFKEIAVSRKTERRLSMLMRTMQENLSSPDN
ncbi:hypothetical protein T265_04152 [Opisthorchis viverrini]|uniref:Uncharacterized protein n=1 Tax=Opisthorchis viverrini TaxID=6198 RepID=A0A074ZTJ0_OPIVI|nr:hypothetical protein T265_04152 [Opisthorchis viverrini]KER29142.1 hypothetical protein T265_04152 [Opisthorchis viverrini]